MATSFRLAGPGKTARRWLAGGTAAAVVMLGLPIVGVGPASAVTVPGVGFEIDANFDVQTTGNIDWTTVAGTADYVQTFDPVGKPDTTVFQTSSKESDFSTWQVGSPGTAPDKADIGGIWFHKKITDTNSWVVLAWDRATGVGTDRFYFEFNKVKNTGPFPTRSVGDARLTITDQGNGALTLDAISIWNGTDWDIDTTPPAGAFYGASNSDAATVVPSGYGFSSPNFTTKNGVTTIGEDQFYEIAFDLGTLGLLPDCPNPGFGVINFRDATGDSPDNLKDFTDPLEVNIPSKCAQIAIEKKDANGNYIGLATFRVSKNPLVKNSTTDLLITDNDENDSNPAVGKILITGVVPGPTYTITEETAPAGYIKDSSSSYSVKAEARGSYGPFVFTNRLGSVVWTKASVPAGDFWGATTPLGGATFTVTAKSGAAAAAPWNLGTNPITVVDNQSPDKDPAAGAIKLEGLPTGTYEVVETDAPTGYKVDTRPGSFTISNTTQQSVSLAKQPSGTESTFRDEPFTATLAVHKSGTKLDGTVEDLPGTKYDVYRVVGTQDLVIPVVDDVKVGSVTTGSGGVGTISGLAWGSSYYFVETEVPSPYNLSDPRWTVPVPISAQQAENTPETTPISTTEVNNKVTSLTTSATPTVSLGGSIKDTATLGNLPTWAKGTLTFNVYGPFALSATTCVGQTASVFTSTVSVSGSGVYDSASFTPTKEGRYFWVANFTTDSATAARGILGATGACGDPNETSAVTLEKPVLDKAVTGANGENVSGGVEVGATLKYSVTITNEGNVPLTGPVTDALPLGLEAPTNISDGGTFDLVTYTITWPSVTLQPGASKTYTYQAKVAAAAASPNLDVLVNTARWLTLQDQTRTPVKWIELTASTFCDVDTPRVNYAVITHNLPANGPVTIQFLDINKNPVGAATVDGVAESLTFLPVSGQLLYPGTAVVGGNVVDWPGWTFADGKWTKDDPNALAGIYVQATVNPTVTSGERFYPPAADGCTPPSIPGLDKSSPTEEGSVGNPSGNVLPGATIDYTITLTNDGGTAETSDLVDTLPAGVTPVAGSYSPSAPTTVAGQTLTWKNVTVGAGETLVVTFKATLSTDAKAGDYQNDATWAGLSAKTMHHVVPGVPNLFKTSATELGSTGNPTGVVLPGATVPYQITLTNTGGETVTSDLVDTLPVGVTPVPSSFSTAPTSVSGQTITWAAVSLKAGETFTVTFDVIVDADVAPGNLVNTATWAGKSDQTTHVVTPGVPGLDKSSPNEKTETQSGEVLPGSTIDYTVTLTNTGGSQVVSDLVDALPVGVAPVADSYSTAPDSVVNGVITWKNVTLAAGATFVVTFKATVSPDVVAGNLVNTATWAGKSDQTVHVVTPGVPGLDKSSTTEVDSELNPSGVVLPDQTVPYTITLTNTGGAKVTSDLIDTLPEGVTPVEGSFSTEPTSIEGQVITWTNVSVASGQTFTVTFEVTVDADVAAGDLVNTAEWAGKSDFTTHVVEPAEPGVDKNSPTEVGSEERPSGNVVTDETVHYVVTVTNTGGAAYTGDIVDTLPAGVSDPRNFTVDTEGFTAEPDIAGQELRWPEVTLIGGQTVTFEFDVTVSAQPDPGTTEDLINSVTWGELPPQTTRHIVAGPGVEIVPTLEKTADPETGSVVKVGDVITYTVKVGNNGNVPLTGDLVDTLPAGIEVVGNYTRDDGGKAEPDTATTTTLTWNDVTVQPGQVVTFTYDIEVLDSAQDQDSLVNTAEWLGLEAGTEHTVTVPQLPQTGLGANPLTTVGWAAGLLLLGAAFLLMGRRREEGEQA